VTESRASVNFNSSMISFSKAMGAVFFMRENPTLWEQRSQANKKLFRAGRENIDNPASARERPRKRRDRR
ncbi:MAG: hypothetical protein ACKOD5_12150, partial [Chthoniobacterales bacterium]